MSQQERDKPVTDLLEFIAHLRTNPGRHRVADLCERYGVGREQIRRWCKYAEERFGIPIQTAQTDASLPRGYIKLPEHSPEPLTITLDRAEVEALMTAAVRIKPLTPLAEQALTKLREVQRLPASAGDAPVLYTPLSDDYIEGLFERVAGAIRNRRVAKVTYRNSRGEENTYNFNSYLIVPSNQHLHLIGVSHPGLEAGSAEPIRLRLDQIRAFKQTRERFPKPALDVRAWADRAFSPFAGEGEPVPVKVRFSPEKAQFIRRTRRHMTQHVEENEDGSVVWSIVAPLSKGLVHWVSSYGPHAEVLEPLALREWVRVRAQGSVAANR